MSNLTLNVEVLAGTSIVQAAEETAALAAKLDLNIGFDFNGIRCFVVVGWSADRIVKSYENAQVRMK